MKKIAFYTLGCKVNQADTAGMEKLFRTAGYETVPFEREADVYLINTCVVTNIGQRKSRQIIRRAVRKNPGAVIAVAGCYPQTAAEEVGKIKGVDILIGNQDRLHVVELVESALEGCRTDTVAAVHKLEAGTAFEELPADDEAQKTRAFLKIQEGCNQFCTFCIIPYARGPLRSRSLDSITEEVKVLVGSGFREVVLLGIHLGAYGKENSGISSLSAAVTAALSVSELERLRLGSLESIEVEDELLSLMAADSRLQRHLHLPLQSGSDRILQLMHRPYDSVTYANLLCRIRQTIPDVAITTDIIVGFPGETEEDFTATKEFAIACCFSKIHIFPFSARKGTPAENFPGAVPEKTKQRRAAELAQISEESHSVFCRSMLGKTVEVLFEDEVEGLWEGLSGNYLRIYAPFAEKLAGKIACVKLVKLWQDGLYGEVEL